MISLKVLVLGVKGYPHEQAKKSDRRPGGTGQYIENLLHGLLNHNLKVAMITKKLINQSVRESQQGLEIHRVGFIPGKYTTLLSFNFFSYLIAKRLCKVKQINLIHAHGPFAILSAYLLGKRFQIPVAGTPHGHRTKSCGTGWFLINTIEHKIYPKIDSLVFLSEQEKRNFMYAFDIKFKNATIIPSGIKLKKDHPRCAIRKNPSPFKMVFTGRLVPVKAIDDMIKSALYLPQEIQNNIRYLIVGNGYEKEKLMKLSRELKLDHIVSFEGFHSDIYPYLTSADCYILPSHSEGFPMSILEAMSVGLPCVVNNWGSFLPKDSVYVMPDNKPETIAKVITELYKNSDLRKNIGENAYGVVREKYSFDKVVEKHIEFYKKLCGVKI